MVGMVQIIRTWVKGHFSDPQIVLLGVLLLAGTLMIYFLGQTLAPILASIVIAYLLDGLMSRLQQYRFPRSLSLTFVFLMFLATLALLVGGLLPIIWRQITQLLQELPAMIAAGQKVLMKLPANYPDLISEAQIRQFLDFVNREMTRIGQYVLSISLASIRGLLAALVYLVLVPLLVYFFLKDKEKIIDWVGSFLPEERTLAKEVWKEVNQQIGNYIRGKIWEILIVWGVSYAVFSWLGLEFALLISLFVGLSVLVPYVGAIFMFIPVASIGFFQWGWTSELAWAVSAYLIIQGLDGNLLAPLLLSGVVNMHPIAIIAAVLLFGQWWGFWGLVFAVPLATLAHAVFKVWFVKQKEMDEALD
jgi:putative permease